MAVVESQGTTLGVDDVGASPVAYTTVGNVVDVTGLRGGQATVIDVSNLGSTAREKLMGLPDEGQVQLTLQYDPDDTGQTELETARDNRTRKSFQITMNDGSPATTFTFNGYVLTFGVDFAVDQVVQSSITIEIDGSVTKA